VARQVIAAIFPWAPKHERRAAIAAAAGEKETSRAAAEHSREVQGQLARLARENHYALTITDQIIRGHKPDGGQ
jgi:hypothetical protein